MISSGHEHDHRRRAVNDAAQIFAAAEQPCESRIRILQSKSAKYQDDEAGEQQPMLRSLIHAQPDDVSNLPSFGDYFLTPNERVVKKHAPDRQNN